MRAAANANGKVDVSKTFDYFGERDAYTWTLVVLRTPTLGVRGLRRSEAAMKAATTNATVVKKPKAFWRRTTEEYMVGDRSGLLRPCSSRKSGTAIRLPV